MPRYSKRATGSVKRKPTAAKKTYGKFAKAAKAKRTAVARTAKSKNGSGSVKKLAVSNARQIASLKEKQFGPLQSNTTIMTEPQVVTASRPACLHLNNLVATGTFASPWIRSKQILIGSIKPIMDTYLETNNWTVVKPHSERLHDRLQDDPDGTKLLWKKTRLDFEITGWVERTYVDIYIVKQKFNAPRTDPWLNDAPRDRPRVLPYTLPQFREMSGPMASNYIDKTMVDVVAHKRVYIDSIPEAAPHTVVHNVAGSLAGAVGEVLDNDGDNAMKITALPRTKHVKHCSITITPNKVVKQLYDAVDSNGMDDDDFDASARVPGAGAWKFDNMKPSDNWWCLISSSDEGDSAAEAQHRTTVKVKRYNQWRDETEARRMTTQRQIEVKAAAAAADVDPQQQALQAELVFLKDKMDVAALARNTMDPATMDAYMAAKMRYEDALQHYNQLYGVP